MCVKVVERYALCRCIYYSHQVDACPAYGRRGHKVKTQEVLIGYTCSRHTALQDTEDFVADTETLSVRSMGSEADKASDIPEDGLKDITVADTIGSPLRDQLLASFAKVFDTDEHFIPAGDLDRVLSAHAVEVELQSHGLEGLLSLVFQHAKKTFAILLVMQKLDALQDLIDAKMRDELLPLEESALTSLEDSKLRAAFSGWDLDARKQFLEIQWTLIAPVFSEGEHLRLDDNARLPFIKTERLASGRFGSVHRVEIHPNHEIFETVGSHVSQKVTPF